MGMRRVLNSEEEPKDPNSVLDFEQLTPEEAQELIRHFDGGKSQLAEEDGYDGPGGAPSPEVPGQGNDDDRNQVDPKVLSPYRPGGSKQGLGGMGELKEADEAKLEASKAATDKASDKTGTRKSSSRSVEVAARLRGPESGSSLSPTIQDAKERGLGKPVEEKKLPHKQAPGDDRMELAINKAGDLRKKSQVFNILEGAFAGNTSWAGKPDHSFSDSIGDQAEKTLSDAKGLQAYEKNQREAQHDKDLEDPQSELSKRAALLAVHSGMIEPGQADNFTAGMWNMMQSGATYAEAKRAHDLDAQKAKEHEAAETARNNADNSSLEKRNSQDNWYKLKVAEKNSSGDRKEGWNKWVDLQREKFEYEKSQNQLPGFENIPGMNPSKEGMKKLRDNYASSATIDGYLTILEDEFKKHGQEFFAGPDFEQMNQAREMGLQELNKLHENGVMNPGDYQSMVKILGSQDSVRTFFSTPGYQQNLKGLRSNVRSKLLNKAAANGLRPQGSEMNQKTDITSPSVRAPIEKTEVPSGKAPPSAATGGTVTVTEKKSGKSKVLSREAAQKYMNSPDFEVR